MIGRDARKRRPWARGPRALDVMCVLAFVMACSRDTDVGCSPTPSCSAREDRFAPRDVADAGPDPCDSTERRCEAIAIAAGDRHTCAIARAGEVVCWGDDAEGQRGSFPSGEPTPTAFQLRFAVVLQHATAVTAGGAHTCAITDDGSVWCWGRDVEGQVDGRSAEMRGVELVESVGHATAIDAGEAHTCAVVEDGVMCWGSGLFGQSGREIADAPLAPGLVDGTSGAIAVSAGARHTCALFESGRVSCWGEILGPMGTPITTVAAAPVPGIDDATAVSAGAGHTCAIRAGGRLVCWGTNNRGQLGDGTTVSRAAPAEVTGIDRALDVSCGGAVVDGVASGHTCIVDSGFFVQCWGRNTGGQLGIGTAEDSLVPVTVLERPDRDDEELYMDDVVGIAAGAFHACALDDDGPIDCWGLDEDDQLGASSDDDDERLFGRAVRVERFSRFGNPDSPAP